MTAMTTQENEKNVALLILIDISAFICFVLSIIARAIFIRVAASMLPEEDEPIVALDRHFYDKTGPGNSGRSSGLTIGDAWHSFAWTARIRYIKIVLQAIVIEIILPKRPLPNQYLTAGVWRTHN